MLYLPTLASLSVLASITSATITLGTGGAYGVFAASTISNTGSTIINGKLGLYPGTSVTGFPPGESTGEDLNNDNAATAQSDLQSCYNALLALPCTNDLTGQTLGGQTLYSGVYEFNVSGQLTGKLTLDAENNSDALFVFKLGSTLTTSAEASVVLINGAKGCNIYWQVGSSATLGTSTSFAGNVLAEVSITAMSGVSDLDGGLYALTAAVTLDTSNITPEDSCGGGSTSGEGTTATGGVTTATGGGTSGGGTTATGGGTSGGGTTATGGSTSAGDTTASGGSTSGGSTTATGGSTTRESTTATGGSTTRRSTTATGESTTRRSTTATGGSTTRRSTTRESTTRGSTSGWSTGEWDSWN
jgi:hypothetical protein